MILGGASQVIRAGEWGLLAQQGADCGQFGRCPGNLGALPSGFLKVAVLVRRNTVLVLVSTRAWLPMQSEQPGSVPMQGADRPRKIARE